MVAQDTGIGPGSSRKRCALNRATESLPRPDISRHLGFDRPPIRGAARRAHSPAPIWLDPSFGLAAQAGLDVELGSNWLVNADVRWMDIDTDAKLNARILEPSRSIHMRSAPRLTCGAGDVLYVPANTPHRFESWSADFRTWVIYVRPHGDEL